MQHDADAQVKRLSDALKHCSPNVYAEFVDNVGAMLIVEGFIEEPGREKKNG